MESIVFRISAVVAAVALATVTAAAPAWASTDRVVHFDLSLKQQPENITLEPNGSADLTFSQAGQVARVTKDGRTTILAQLPGGVAGIVRTPDGTLYVNVNAGAQTGIYQLRHGGSRLFAKLPAGFVNGLALDGRTLYATDSSAGQVWRIPLDTAKPTVWAQGGPLAKVSAFGSNGIKVHDGAVWVSNTDTGDLLRIPIKRNGSAGPVEIKASGLAGIDDFTFDGPNVLAAINSASELALIRPNGAHTVVRTAANGLSNPTSVAVRGKSVYVASAAYRTQSDPNLLITRF
jgi:hypothetical protein